MFKECKFQETLLSALVLAITPEKFESVYIPNKYLSDRINCHLDFQPKCFGKMLIDKSVESEGGNVEDSNFEPQKSNPLPEMSKLEKLPIRLSFNTCKNLASDFVRD